MRKLKAVAAEVLKKPVVELKEKEAKEIKEETEKEGPRGMNEENFKDENELDDAQEEAVVIAEEIFEEGWKRIKKEIEGASKKEACKYSFILGFLDYMKMMDEKAKAIEKQMKDMSKEDIEKLVKNFKDYGEKKMGEKNEQDM